MRAAISLFISGLLLGSLAVNTQASGIQVSNSGIQELMSAKKNTNKPTRRPYRGSGRKEMVQHIEITHPVV
ncbi:heterocyst-inhibiting protein PatX [Mastigocladopsis repens]|uniref:heterocyst-inhibiting protein PatX n=1 Tax=Mastigocladopsis repens TaxID=221287 RepID=UPI0002F75C80|nr:hypothetical protein [Mastigocladopsis repens]